MKDIPLAIASLLFLIVGIFGLSLSGTETVAKIHFSFLRSSYTPINDAASPESEEERFVNSATDHSHYDGIETVSKQEEVVEVRSSERSLKERLFGMACAVTLG